MEYAAINIKKMLLDVLFINSSIVTRGLGV